MRRKLLKGLYKFFPFDLAGHWCGPFQNNEKIFSCLIPASRPENLKNILEDLSIQNFPKSDFEVIVVKDGNPHEIDRIVRSFEGLMFVVCLEAIPGHVIGHLRNQSLSSAKGKYALFLDDDTRIFQKDFLKKALEIFEKTDTDIILPLGRSLYGVRNWHQDFLDQFSFATRCCLYRKSVLEGLKGFRNLNSYSDIELSMRVSMTPAKSMSSDELSYFHPPLCFLSLQKPLAIGGTIFKLRRYYPLWAWTLIYCNALRFLPLLLWPFKSNRPWAMISLGVLVYPLKPKNYLHRS